MWKKSLNKVLATLYPDWINMAMKSINGWRGLYWKQVPAAMLLDRYTVLSYGKPFEFSPIDVEDPSIVDSLTDYNNMEQKEYFLSFPDELVFEPRYGWAMSRRGELIMDSLHYTYYALLPGLRHYLRSLHPPRDILRLGKLASFRDIGDKNYYHFYDDHLAKLPFFRKMGVRDDVPLLISDILFNKPYFQEALERTGLDKRTWIVQGKDYVAAKESCFCGTMRVTREYLDYVLELLKPPRPDSGKRRRIFITRGKADGRCISNIVEIEELLNRFDFESVNLDGAGLGEQMRLFSEAGTVVGIHGAGLTNIIFRAGAALDVIELFPPNNIPAMYYWICSAYGFGYDALVGHKKNWSRADRQQWAMMDFEVDADMLERKVVHAISRRHTTAGQAHT